MCQIKGTVNIMMLNLVQHDGTKLTKIKNYKPQPEILSDVTLSRGFGSFRVFFLLVRHDSGN